MMKETPLVTICTLVYNSAEYVLSSLESIRSQIYYPIEHFIVDDFSTDSSAEVIEDWINKNQHQCEYIRHYENKGICASLNEVILKSKGKYFFGISDDLMMPDKLIKDVEYLEANPSFAFCCTNMIIQDEFTGNQTLKKYNDETNLFYKLLNGSATIATPTVVYKTMCLKEAGLFDEEILFEDYDMFLRLLNKYSSGYRNEYSVIYCIHKKSIQSLQEIKFHNEFFKILSKWKHLPNYWYYRNNRHQLSFCHFSVKNKKEALNHFFPALSIFWHTRFYKAFFKFLFFWPKDK